jgi:hypothetical protein
VSLNALVDWLTQTTASTVIQTNEWVIPTVQSVHIVAIGVVLGSVFMVTLRSWDLAGRDQSPSEIFARFDPWLVGAMVVLLATGVIMIVGEPARELLALSFWMKMGLLLIGVAMVTAFRRALRAHLAADGLPGPRALAVATLVVWLGVVVLGRLIAYDHVWGSWSAAFKG